MRSFYSYLFMLFFFHNTGFVEVKLNELDQTLNKVAQWQIDNHSYLEEGNLHDYGIDAWTNSVFYLGLSKWASNSSEGDKYNKWLYTQIGEKNEWVIPANFKQYPKYSLYHADELAIGQFYTDMYDKLHEEPIISSLKERVDWIMNTAPDENMTAHNKQIWSWCDALFMAPPVYAAMAKITSNDAYLSYMHMRYKQTFDSLYDQKERLFYRDSSYFNKKEANGEKVFWGRGNGWVVAGLCNILDLMPQSDSLRSFYITLYQDMIERLLELRDENGFWHASLLDPQSYPAPETSATAMITYAIGYGINNNLLDRDKYLPILLKSWNALLSIVDSNGRIGYVQPIGADPKNVTKDMTAVYGVGAFLLAGNEMYKLTNK